MSIDATAPADSVMVADIPASIRDTRAFANTIEAMLSGLSGLGISTNFNVSAGATAIAVGGSGGLSLLVLEHIVLTGSGVAVIDQINDGSAGQIKIFQFADANVTFAKSTNLVLNQLNITAPFGGDRNIVALVNVGGDPTLGVDGYWMELFRTERVD